MASLLTTGSTPLLPVGAEAEAVRLARVKLLYRGLPYSLGTTLAITLGIIFIGLQAAPPSRVWIWALLMLSFIAMRGGLLYAWNRSAERESPAWESRFLAATLGSGLVWGATPFLVFHQVSGPHLMFIAVVLAGVCGGAQATLGSHSGAALRMVVPTCLGLCLRMFQVEGSLGIVLGLSSLLYLAVLYSAIQRMGAVIPEYVVSRMRAETARESEQRARNLLEDTLRNAPILLAIYDPEDRLVQANELYLSLYPPHQAAQVIGRPFRENLEAALHVAQYRFRNPEEKQAFAEARLLSHATPGKSFMVYVGDRTYRLVDARTAEGGILTLGVDITVEQAQHETLSLALESAMDASKAKTRFLSHVSHEFRTPLNAIMGFTTLLQLGEEGPITPGQAAQLQHVQAGARHLLTLVEEVIELSKIESGGMALRPEEVGSVQFAEEVVDLMAAPARKANVELERTGVDDVILWVDRQRMQQILLNLLSNAIKYNYPGGFVRLEGSNPGNGLFRWTVTDNGSGIPTEQQSHVFDPFNRLGRESLAIEGTGIGLTLARRLAEAMGGTMGFASEAGKGSVFWVDLPLGTGAARNP